MVILSGGSNLVNLRLGRKQIHQIHSVYHSNMNVSEFAKIIKDKYPVYKGIDDLELVNKVITKYPVYKDKVQFEAPPILAPAMRPTPIATTLTPTADIMQSKYTPSIILESQAELTRLKELGRKAGEFTREAFAEGMGEWKESIKTRIRDIAPVEQYEQFGRIRSVKPIGKPAIAARAVLEAGVDTLMPETFTEIGIMLAGGRAIDMATKSGIAAKILAKYPGLTRKIELPKWLTDKIGSEIQSLRYRVGKKMGVEFETGVIPFDTRKALQEGRISLAEAAKQSKDIWKEELAKRIILPKPAYRPTLAAPTPSITPVQPTPTPRPVIPTTRLSQVPTGVLAVPAAKVPIIAPTVPPEPIIATVPTFGQAIKPISHDEMLVFQNDFETLLKLDRDLEAYGAKVNPENVYKAAEKYTPEQLKALSNWYKYRGQEHTNPAQIMISAILDDIISKKAPSSIPLVGMAPQVPAKPATPPAIVSAKAAPQVAPITRENYPGQKVSDILAKYDAALAGKDIPKFAKPAVFNKVLGEISFQEKVELDKSIVENFPERIKELQISANTLPTGEYSIPSRPGKIKPEANPVKALAPAIEQDKRISRPQLLYAYGDTKNGVYVATNGRILSAIPAKNVKPGYWITKNDKKAAEIAGTKKEIAIKYPNWKQVVPKELELSYQPMPADLYNRAMGVAYANKQLGNDNAVTIKLELGDKDYYINADYLRRAIEPLIVSGAKQLRIGFSIQEKPIKIATEGKAFSLVMPLSSHEKFATDRRFTVGMKRIKKSIKVIPSMPITPISKPTDIVELGAGPFPPKQVRDTLNSALSSALPAEEKISAMGQVLRFYLGTRRERYQVLAGNKEKGDAWYNALRRMNADFNSVKAMVESRNRAIFRGLSLGVRAHIHDIAKGISINASGEIVGGGIQPAGTMKFGRKQAIGPGSVLPDGRIVGSALEEGGNEYQLYRRFDTLREYKELIGKYPQAKIVFDKFLALREDRLVTKLGAEIPAFSREVIKEQYQIKTVHPQDYRYVPSIRMEDKFFAKIGNLFKSYTASARKYKTGILTETDREDKDLLRTLTSKQNEIAFEGLFNNTVGDILATILEPIGKGGVKSGFKEVNLNEPRLAKIIALKKDLLCANGIDVDKIYTYQYPMNIDKEFNISRTAKFSPEIQNTVDTLARRTNQMVGYILSNYLIRPSTAVRNATSGFIQYDLRILTHLNKALLGEGITPAVNDIKALGRAFMPYTIKELPKEILGLNFYSDIPENVKIMDVALIPFRAVETYYKRASFDSDLSTMAGNKFQEALTVGLVKPVDKQKFIHDYRNNYFVDLFNWMADNADSVTLNYWNKPWFLEKMSNSIGRGLVPFPNYFYQKWRMYAEYSPLTLKDINRTNWKDKVAKAMAGVQIFTITAAISSVLVERRKEKIKELELKKLPWKFDTTGRIKVYSDETIERWLRVYDLPYLGDTLYMMEILQNQTGIDDWMRDSLAMGPIFNTMAMFMGLRTKYTTGLAVSAIAGQQIAGFIPFGAYMQYLRIMGDPVKRQTFAKDYNAFQNFMNPILSAIPGVSKELAPQIGRIGEERGQIRKYDIPAETIKLFFLNIRSIDKKEYMQYVHDQFRRGKVKKRIEKTTHTDYLRKKYIEEVLKK